MFDKIPYLDVNIAIIMQKSDGRFPGHRHILKICKV